MLNTRLFAVATVVGAAVLLAGCGGSGSTSGAAKTTSKTTQAIPATTTSKVPAAPLLNRRAENGEIVQQSGLTGSGTLQITNGNKSDFAIVVTTGKPTAPQATIYVRGNSEATLSGIAGAYYVYMKSGTDWDAATLRFTRDANFQKFDDLFDANSAWEITLQPSIGGNASTSDVPAF